MAPSKVLVTEYESSTWSSVHGTGRLESNADSYIPIVGSYLKDDVLVGENADSIEAELTRASTDFERDGA